MPRPRPRRAALALVCLVAGLGSNRPCRADTYAFLVGVSNYENKGAIRSLKFACDDVISFAGVLRNNGVPLKNIVLLSDQQSNPRFRPTRQNILTEYHLLLATLEPEDALIVALAGHGIQLGATADHYFLPADAQPKDPATLIDVKTIYQELEQSQAGRKLLLVDACRNDPESDTARSAGNALLPARRLASDPIPKGIAALFSCNSEQRSHEDTKLRHGIFFYQVIKAWEGAADLDRNGQVTLEELEGFVRRETKNYVRDELRDIQTPVFRVDAGVSSGWVLTSLARARAETAAAAAGAQPAHQALGKSHLARGLIAEAVREYSEALKLDPNDASSYVGRAVAHGAGGNLEAALSDYEQAIRLDPGNVLAHVGQGAILARLGRLDEAIAACNRAILLDGKSAKAYYNRGVAREAKQDKAGAARDFQKAEELDPRLKSR